MKKNVKKWRFLVLVDLLLVAIAFSVSGFVGKLPEFWILSSVAISWVAIGALLGRLNFTEFSRIRYAWITIFLVNLFCALLFYAVYAFLGRVQDWGWNYICAIILLTALEFGWYLLFRHLVLRQIPFANDTEEIERYHYLSAKHAAKMLEEEQSPDLRRLLYLFRTYPLENPIKWRNILEGSFSAGTKLMTIHDRKELEGYTPGRFKLFVNLTQLNKIRRINKFFIDINALLDEGDTFVCCCQTSTTRKLRIFKAYPWGLNYLIYTLDYSWNRICPKLPFLKKIYFAVTRGQHRVFPRPEILGRLYSCGFEVKQEEYIHNLFYIVAVKTKLPFDDPSPSYGLLVRLRRVGKAGKLIGVYKFRTMHAYAEYLQPYIYQHNQLQEGGKFADDYRISVFGRFMRKCWLDELPMLINILKGDMKLVGVRPLSQHYYSLYSPELQQLRIRTKPGLLPPFYVDMPKNLEEIEASERRYLESYFRYPFLTDWRYFWKIWYNILIKRKRSA